MEWSILLPDSSSSSSSRAVADRATSQGSRQVRECENDVAGPIWTIEAEVKQTSCAWSTLASRAINKSHFVFQSNGFHGGRYSWRLVFVWRRRQLWACSLLLGSVRPTLTFLKDSGASSSPSLLFQKDSCGPLNDDAIIKKKPLKMGREGKLFMDEVIQAGCGCMVHPHLPEVLLSK